MENAALFQDVEHDVSSFYTKYAIHTLSSRKFGKHVRNVERAKLDAHDYADLGYRLELGGHVYDEDIFVLCSYFSDDFITSMNAADNFMITFNEKVLDGKRGSTSLYTARLLYERASYDVGFLLEQSYGIDSELESYDDDQSFIVKKGISFDSDYGLQTDLREAAKGYTLCLLAMEYPSRYEEIFIMGKRMLVAASEDRFEDAGIIRDKIYGNKDIT